MNMNMKRMSLAVAAVVAMVMSAQAENFVWSAADGADWSSLSNWKTYEPRVTATRLPGKGDSIYLGGVGWTFHYHADNAAESAIFQSVKEIRPLETGSTVIIDVPEGTELTITNCLAYTAYPKYGNIYIRGGGTVRIKSTGCSDCRTAQLVLEAGTLYLPDNIDATNVKQSYYLGNVTVAEGAVLYLPSDFRPGKDSHIEMTSLRGGGTIYNNRPLAGSGGTYHTELRITGNYPNYEFTGSFGDTVKDAHYRKVWLFCNGNLKLTGQSSTPQRMRAYGGNKTWSTGSQLFGFSGFGMRGDATAAIGNTDGIEADVKGANLLYLGNGETTDKFVYFYPCSEGYTTLDAGANGGIILGSGVDSSNVAKGGFSPATTANVYMPVVGLNGSNSVPCVLRGLLNKFVSTSTKVANETQSPMVIKKGTGTWRFADPEGGSPRLSRNFGGAIEIDEGVFQYDSISPIGEYCSVGDGTMWTDPSGTLTNYENATTVNWQFALGGKAANLTDDAEGTLEYTGTKDEYAADRPIVLRGNGRLRANSAGKIRYRMLAPELTKNATLTLDGSSTADNEVADLMDGATKTLAVVKEGSGKWILSGTNTFSGGLTVKGGTLVLKRPGTRYTWFKFTVKEMNEPIVEGRGRGQICVNHMGLYDAEGNNLIGNLSCPDSTNIAEIAEGQAGLATDRRHGISAADFAIKGLTNMFALAKSGGYGFVTDTYKSSSTDTVYPTLSNPQSWLPIVMRLNPGTTTSVATYDWVYYYSYCGTKAGFQWTPSIWSLEGSVDGIHWDNVKTDAETAGENWTTTTADFDHGGDYRFFFSQAWKNYSLKTLSDGGMEKHSNGCAINGDAADAFPVSISSVKVSGGSTFKFEGVGKLSMGTLELDASANTIEGVMFSGSGDLNITGTLAKGGSVPLATTFNNCSGVDLIANWAFTINGAARPSYSLAYEDGKLVVKRPGTIMIVR